MVEVVSVLEHRLPYVLWPEPVVRPAFCMVPGNPILAAHKRNSQSGLQDLLAEGGLDQLDRKGSRGVALIENRIDFDHFQ